jgi:hypothetical protein
MRAAIPPEPRVFQPNRIPSNSPMRKTVALAALLTIGAPLAVLAQSHTPEDEAACSPDVMALCQQYIPKRADIIACLIGKKRELSPACSEVFSRPPSAHRAEENPRRGKRKPVSQAGDGNLN